MRGIDRKHVFAFLAQWLPLLAVLGLALALRLIFVTGMVFSDDLGYAQAANDLTRGVFRLSPWPAGQARIGLYAPTALLYLLFGANDVTTLAWPLFCSLLSVVFIYHIGRVLAGESTGLLASFLWTLLPLDISAATSFLPDGPLATFSSGAVLFFLIGERAQGRRAWLMFGLSLACLGYAILIKPLGLIVLVFIVVYVVSRRRLGRQLWIGLAGAVAVGLALIVYYFVIVPRHGPAMDTQVPLLHLIASTATDWWDQVLNQSPEFRVITPLVVVAVVIAMANRRREAVFPLLWLGSMFFYFEFGSISPFRYQPISVFRMIRHILLVIPPAVILAGMYLAKGMSTTTVRRLVVGLGFGIVTIAWIGSRGASPLPGWVIGQNDLERPFAVLSALGAVVAVFGSFASPSFVLNAPPRWRTVATFVLLGGIAMATLGPTYEAVTKYRMPWVGNARQAVRFLQNQPGYPILAQNALLAARLNYEAGFQWGFDYFQPDNPDPAIRLSVAPTDPDQLSNAYVVVDGYFFSDARDLGGEFPAYLETIPDTWWEIAHFGEIDRYQLKIYRVLASGTASEELRSAREAASTMPSSANLHRLVGAATNANDSCAAVTALRRLNAMEPQTPSPDLVQILGRCFADNPQVAGPNLLQNGDFSSAMDSWYREEAWGNQVRVEKDVDGTPLLHIVADGLGNQVILIQGVTLMPDTPYVYEAVIQSDTPVVSLYWESDVGRFYSEQTYPTQTKLTYIFVTPHWDDLARKVNVHPVLVKGKGQVYIKQIRLAQLNLESP